MKSKVKTYERKVTRDTGLLDKNGLKIQEGDFVNFHIFGVTHERYPEDVKDAEVWWDDEYAMFLFGRFKDWSYPELGEWGYCRFDGIDPNSFEIVKKFDE
jgi:hypothetical protein